MKIFKKRRRFEIHFDFISLSIANISFIILSFFALSIPKKEKGILFAFQNPSISAKSPQNEISNYIRFSINDKGETFIEDEQVKFGDIENKLKNYLIEDSSRTIYLIIHQNAPYEYLIIAFDKVYQTFNALKLSPKLSIGIIRR